MEELSDYRLWQLIRHTTHLIDKARQRELHRYGITWRSSGIMHMIFILGKRATPVEIAKQLARERHTISEQLTRLEREGLIIKIKDLERKNLVRVELTEKGYKSIINPPERKSTNHIMGVLNTKEQKNLWILMVKLRDEAMKYLGLDNNEPYPPPDTLRYLPLDEYIAKK